MLEYLKYPNSKKRLAVAGITVLMALYIVVNVLMIDLRLFVALTAVAAIFMVGMRILRGLARPVPPPPEPGLLRKVKLHYQCTICGAEVRMTVAPKEDPDPPRHCQEDMKLLTPIF